MHCSCSNWIHLDVFIASLNSENILNHANSINYQHWPQKDAHSKILNQEDVGLDLI
jgi:hypothetical protein